jgi:hypothetical protein
MSPLTCCLRGRRISQARALSNLGITMSALARPADALPAEEDAVAIYRELTAATGTGTVPASPAR